MKDRDIFDWTGFTLNRFGGELADNDPTTTKNTKPGGQTQKTGVSPYITHYITRLYIDFRHVLVVRRQVLLCSMATGIDATEEA